MRGSSRNSRWSLHRRCLRNIIDRGVFFASKVLDGRGHYQWHYTVYVAISLCVEAVLPCRATHRCVADKNTRL